MKRAYVIYCPQQGGYWAGKTYNEFKGELYAEKFDRMFYDLQIMLNSSDFYLAIQAAKGNFIEIKEIYYDL